MLRKSGIRSVAAIVGLILTASLIWWGYQTHQEREQGSAIASLTLESGRQLREALILDGGPPADMPEETARRLEGHYSAVDKALQKLRGMDVSLIRDAADAADDYLLTIREILRRLAASQHSSFQFSQSSNVLLGHMRADRGGGAWVAEAVRLKDRVEEDYSEHKAATETLTRLLETFPAAQDRIVPYVKTMLPIDEKLLDDARQRTLESAKQTADKISKIRKWVPRGQGRHQPL